MVELYLVSVKSLLNLVWWLVFVDLLEAVSTSCSVELVLSADVFGPRRLILKSFVWMKVINEIHFVGNLSAVWSSLWFLSCVKEEGTFLSVFLSLQMTFCVQCNLDQVSSCKFVAQNLHLTKYDFYQLEPCWDMKNIFPWQVKPKIKICAKNNISKLWLHFIDLPCLFVFC